ncbi:BrnT family toxin [Blastomonas sp.]|uniref:BrnT family toxin n=1 Tax=Blastomonas sp. TaxID=1909299 RepID=UPI00391D803E
MQFEFDPAKSALNRQKHGIDFVEAQALWQDVRRAEFDAQWLQEQRFGLIAKFGGKLWTAIHTVRGDCIRIISVRRSRPAEVKVYETQDD